MAQLITYVAFLRGINVGGNKKVPMAELKTVLQKMNLQQPVTLLNSGNVIFDTTEDSPSTLEREISEALKNQFGFPVPTIIRKAETIQQLVKKNVFQSVLESENTRLYISFLSEPHQSEINYPYKSEDQSFTILSEDEQHVFSFLDLTKSKTVKAMKILEQHYGKNITTRNLNTIHRIVKKLAERD